MTSQPTDQPKPIDERAVRDLIENLRCHCGDGSPASYEGELRDCPEHGDLPHRTAALVSARTVLELLLRENERLRKEAQQYADRLRALLADAKTCAEFLSGLLARDSTHPGLLAARRVLEATKEQT